MVEARDAELAELVAELVQAKLQNAELSGERLVEGKALMLLQREVSQPAMPQPKASRASSKRSKQRRESPASVRAGPPAVMEASCDLGSGDAEHK
mmetsp:Transcript_26746/g.78143  ORF Transcript_26746/g.78143 Transcript_26746/m.78143 type:complete len:95 (+) Transcript_26746:1158-1442(+)